MELDTPTEGSRGMLKSEGLRLLALIAKAIPRATLAALGLAMLAHGVPTAPLADACEAVSQGTPDKTAVRQIGHSHGISWSESRAALYVAATSDVCDQIAR